jgi:hypothetical protein
MGWELEDWDKTFCEGLPITSPARTLLDTCGTISNFRFERALDQLLSWNVTCIRDCELMVERHASKGRPGAAFWQIFSVTTKMLKDDPDDVRLKLVRALTPTRPTSSAPALSP